MCHKEVTIKRYKKTINHYHREKLARTLPSTFMEQNSYPKEELEEIKDSRHKLLSKSPNYSLEITRKSHLKSLFTINFSYQITLGISTINLFFLIIFSWQKQTDDRALTHLL